MKYENFISRLVDGELETAIENRQDDFDDYQSYIDLLDSRRSEKDYDWKSDIRLPEFVSHILTQSSIDVDQYFKVRDFVEVYLQDESDEALESSKATKELLNRTLNQKHLHHYLKYVRAKTINHLNGHVWAVCWWEKETETEEIDGIEVTRIKKDRFNYEVLDPRNVFTDNKYVYSPQEKDFIYIRSEVNLDELKDSADDMGYFNLDKLNPPQETKTSEETYNIDDSFTKPENSQDIDIYERYGKFHAVWDGEKYVLGVDDLGNKKENAEYIECIMTFAHHSGGYELIRFNEQPYKDADGNRFRNILRGLCYVHPSDDDGVGDGKYSKEIQIAIDDTFNLSNDRAQLATLPTLIGRRTALLDNDTVFFEPEHTIEVNELDDIKELKISDNIGGALAQMGILSQKMDQVTSIYPTTQGNLPSQSSQSATSIINSAQQTNIRTNYKALTFEYTFLTDLYWMIQQMTYQYAEIQTGIELMGDKLLSFNPKLDYYYKPVSQSIETDQSKAAKIQQWTQVLGYVSNIQHPDAIKQVNYILGQIYTYMGDEFVNFKNAMMDTTKQIEGGSDQQENFIAPTNQFGGEQTQFEQFARGNV